MIMAKGRFPIGAGVRMADLSRNPYDTFRQLQQHEPVSWIDEIQMWFITRRADVMTVLADTETFTVQHPGSVLESVLGTNMLTTDGAPQYRLRKPFIATFAPRQMRERAQVQVERLVSQLIDTFIDAGSADLKQDFADKLALLTVTDAIGLPIEDYVQFRGWYTDFTDGLGNFTGDAAIKQRADAAKAAFHAYVAAHLNGEKSLLPGSELVRVRDEGDLSHDEIIDSARVIIFGGLETTAALIANTLWALLNHPDQLAQVRADSGLLVNAIEETLRWESPVQTATRLITRDVNIAGVTMKAGDSLQCMLGAANRDETHFPAAATFDIQRTNAGDHLGFGYGKHYCIGAGLARLEGQIGLRMLFERLLELRFQPGLPNAPRGHEFRSPPQLVLAWG
jgi:cytochrome P450